MKLHMVDTTQNTMKLFEDVKRLLHERKQKENVMLEEIAGKAMDAYRVALGEDFTTQGVLKASTQGEKVKNWEAIEPEMQGILEMLGVRYPQVVDTQRVVGVLSTGVVDYLRANGVDIPTDKEGLFSPLLEGVMQGLKEVGAKYDNGVRDATILGLRPLVRYRDWLVSGGQQFMNLGEYSFELTVTDNAILAAQKVFMTALVVAGDVGVYKTHLDQSRIEKIVSVEPKKLSGYSEPRPLLFTYQTAGKTEGELDIEYAHITSLREKKDEDRIGDLLFEGIKAESGIENLGYEGSVDALVGLSKNVGDELRANVWRKYLTRFGVDFSQAADVVLVNPTETEKVRFFYGTKNRKGEDNGVMISIGFDERYGHRDMSTYSRGKMNEEVTRGKMMQERLGRHYTALLEPMAVRTYLERRERLTVGKL